MQQGASFMAMRTYETRLAVRYLRWHPEVDADAIGLVAHSGGSVASNLTVWLEATVSAYVSDMTGSYHNSGLGNPLCTGDAAAWECLVDETAPQLWTLHQHVDDLDEAPAPVLEVPYGYAWDPDGAVEILAFFEEWLVQGG